MSVKILAGIGELVALRKMFALLDMSHNSVFKWKTFEQRRWVDKACKMPV